MKRIYAVLLASLTVLVCLFASCISREAAERQAGPQEAAQQQQDVCVVTFYDGPTVVRQLTVPMGGKLQDYPKEHEWRDGQGHRVDFAQLTVNSDMSLYAAGNVALLTDHVRFLNEQTQQFRPDEYLTRGQAAQIVCALIVPDAESSANSSYPDVPAGSQYYDAVQTVSSLGVMNGYGDGTFRPDEPISRGELLTVACRMTNTEEMAALAFTDVTAEHWTMGSVAAAMTKGWVDGYEDGNFYPDYPVTRAETAVLMNRVLGRTPNKLAIDFVFKQSPFTDVDRWDWAYYDIVDAALQNEMLSYILGEVDGMRQGFMLIGDQLAHVNDQLKLDYFEAGFHKVEDGLESDGVYYVPEDGYFVKRNQPGLQEFDGAMFYVAVADGPYLCDYDLGYLHFGENGRYTTGDLELDGYVNAIMDPIIQGDTNNLLSEAKLREAYNAILFGGYGYKLQVRTGWNRGTTAWVNYAAKAMFQERRGTCYYWAGAFLVLARRLGYPVVGGVGSNNALHSWVMIDDEYGNEYIYDVKLDWTYRQPYRPEPIMDLFKQPRNNPLVFYIFPGDTYIVPPNDDLELDEETPAIIWPTTPDGFAFVEVDGEMIPLDTTWTPILDEAGYTVGYTITAVYNDVPYTTNYMLDTPIPPSGEPQQTESPDT